MTFVSDDFESEPTAELSLVGTRRRTSAVEEGVLPEPKRAKSGPPQKRVHGVNSEFQSIAGLIAKLGRLCMGCGIRNVSFRCPVSKCEYKK